MTGVEGPLRVTAGSVPLARVLSAAAFLLLVLAVVIPNSVQVPTAVALVITALLALPYVRWGGGFARLLVCYLLAAAVTMLYVFVGLNRGAPTASALQIVFVYIVSPFLWMILFSGLIRAMGAEWLMRRFVLLSILAALTVALFYLLFLTLGPQAVTFFIDNANLNLKDGYAGATMFVYGSLIFLVGGFFAAPGLVSRRLKAVLLGLLAIATVTSGRSALLLCVPIALMTGFVCIPKVSGLTSSGRAGVVKTFKQMSVVAVSCCLAVVLLTFLSEIDFFYITSLFIEKLASGGGTERSQQARALAEGIASSYGLGAGHGVGVDFVRSGRFPWRYELVWLATLLRVGVLGALVYALPFLLSLRKAWLLWKRGEMSMVDVFMLSGMICALLASNTNPYIEAFVFQWMYVLPVTWFFLRKIRTDRHQRIDGVHAA